MIPQRLKAAGYEPMGVGLWRLMGRDGWDYYRICDLHAWMSLEAPEPGLAQHCPFCAVELDRGRRRYERLRAVVSGVVGIDERRRA